MKIGGPETVVWGPDSAGTEPESCIAGYF